MINLINLLGVIGLVCVITRSYIFSGVRLAITAKSRTLGYLISCSQCTGFWAGLIFGLATDALHCWAYAGLVSLAGMLISIYETKGSSSS